MQTVSDTSAGAGLAPPLPVTAVRSVACPLCPAPEGTPCQATPAADHLLRYAEARRRRLISQAEMGAALTATGVITVNALTAGGDL